MVYHLVLVFSILPACNYANLLSPRIVGGLTTTISNVPFQVALYSKNSFICGGSLITKTCVLTAGHCIAGRTSNTLKIRGGISLLSDIGGETRTVSQTYMPEKFNIRSMEMDASILRLNAPLTGTNISPIVLSGYVLSVGDYFQVSGWGLTDENASSASNNLRSVTVQMISKTQCGRNYPLLLKESMFCAGVQGGGKDSCAGDLGGPAVKDGRQVGIVSWGKGCARSNFPGVYTSVKHIMTWVNSVKLMYCAN